MIICVLATASAEGGALSIYKQFLTSLELNHGQDEWHVFIDKNMPMPEMSGVWYHVCHTKGLWRISFDLWGFRSMVHNLQLVPDVIFSLQNTGVRCRNGRMVIYFHQPLPFYKFKCCFFDSFYKTYFFYHYFYPYYIRSFFNNSTYIAVQTQIMKDNFTKRFSFSPHKIGVYFPNMEKIDPDQVESYTFEEGTFNFVYPAGTYAYKEQITIAHALKAIYRMNTDVARQIRVHFTFEEGAIADLANYLKDYHLQENFVFHGTIPYSKVLSMLKSCDALLFPSVIETLGLPLLEAASFGTSVIANDMKYVHEVLEGYNGVCFVPVHDYDKWARNMLLCCEQRAQYVPYTRQKSDSWERLFRLIREGIIIN